MIVVPGLLVASIVGLRLRELSTWAAVPALSLASVFLLGEAATLVHAPFDLFAFVVLLVLLISVAGGLTARRGRRSTNPRSCDELNHDAEEPLDMVSDDAESQSIDVNLARRIEYGLLGLSVAIGGLTWFKGLRGVPRIPPGTDASSHGWFVARILDSHTIDPMKIVTSDAGGKHPAANFYPLALHASAALSTRLGGGDVGRILVAYTVVFSAVVLPVGMFVLARTLAPHRPFVAGFTALVVPLLALFPYFPIHVGDMPQIVAMALVPTTVVVLVRATLARRPRILLSRTCIVSLVPSTLVILCIISTHSSELPLIALLPVLLILERSWRGRDLQMLWTALVRGIAAAAGAAVLYAPTLVAFTRGVSERSAIRSFFPTAAWTSEVTAIFELHFGGTGRQSVLGILAIAGATLWMISRRPAWVVGWFSIVLLAILANDAPNRFADPFTLPWYHLDVRIVPNVAFFVPFFAGITLSCGATLITRLPSPRLPLTLPAVVTIIVALGGLTGVESVRANSAYIRSNFTPDTRSISNEAVVGFSSLAGFRWLHDHVAKGDTVANQPNVDGSLWMYAEQHVEPLVGPYDTVESRDIADRIYLAQHLSLLGHNKRVDDLARRYQTRWVFFDSNQFLGGFYSSMKLPALRSNPSLALAFHDGGTWVFRIRPSA